MATLSVQRQLRAMGDKNIALHSRGFFKTGKDEYGEGDRFLGIRVPALRAQVKTCADLSLDDVTTILQSPWHEERLFALFVLVHRFGKVESALRKQIYQLYLEMAAAGFINNWDLVDCSAAQIVGVYLEDRSRKPLERLAKSNNMWERRVAIIATFHFIRQNEFAETLRIASLLVGDGEDLIHKAVGWMLRETGKRDLSAETGFLNQYYLSMPRTMLRYAIEKFPAELRKAYLEGTVPTGSKCTENR